MSFLPFRFRFAASVTAAAPAASPQSAPSGSAPAAQATPVTTHPTPTWLDLCLPVTKHFETCVLVAYCDPGSPRGRALVQAGLWYAYLKDRSIGDRPGYAGLDPAPWTCGWGSTGPDVTKDTAWTQDEADARLIQRLTEAGNAVDRLVKVELLVGEKAALGDFVFNEGEGSFASSTLLRLVNASDFVNAAKQFGQWDLAGGHVMPGLERRRQADCRLFTTGHWSAT